MLRIMSHGRLMINVDQAIKIYLKKLKHSVFDIGKKKKNYKTSMD